MSVPVASASTPAASIPPIPPGTRVNPIDRAFPADYNIRAALDTRLTNGPIREILGPLVPEQLLGTAQYLACKLTACLQMEKDLAATRDQVDVLTAEKDSASAAPLLHAKIKSLSQKLGLAEGERPSALDRMKEVEERAKVQAAELESYRSALEQERKKVESLTQSLKGKQTALDEPRTLRFTSMVRRSPWRRKLGKWSKNLRDFNGLGSPSESGH
ncbi:hypothetical protein PIB30_039700 [Stylosanthes scabra]|uniref:Uncharacterized protein n=1 Tax=Stylosanthes scabra TaxID=79078 RepID=A0ABU6XCH3_9FABA|nr:hypothetical protein [Stylosanthes scabra]